MNSVEVTELALDMFLLTQKMTHFVVEFYDIS